MCGTRGSTRGKQKGSADPYRSLRRILICARTQDWITQQYFPKADVPKIEKPLKDIIVLDKVIFSRDWEKLVNQGAVVGRFMKDGGNDWAYFVLVSRLGYGDLLLFEKGNSDFSKELRTFPTQEGDGVFLELLKFEKDCPDNIFVFPDSGKVEFYSEGGFQ